MNQTQHANGIDYDLLLRLCPQWGDIEAQPYLWQAYIMRQGAPNFRSDSLNTDAYGFRHTYREGTLVEYNDFMASALPKGIILGNSTSYGVGVTHDRNVVASKLNEIMPDFLWYNFSVRASVTTQDWIAYTQFVHTPVKRVAWIAGINSLACLLLQDGMGINTSPFIGESKFIRAMNPNFTASPEQIETRYRGYLSTLEKQLRQIASTLDSSKDLLFCMQPAHSWTGKPESPEEAQLIPMFDACKIPLELAHKPEYMLAWKNRYDADMRSMCAKLAIRYVNFADCAEFRTNDWLFIDRIHVTDAGHQKMADVISTQFA